MGIPKTLIFSESFPDEVEPDEANDSASDGYASTPRPSCEESEKDQEVRESGKREGEETHEGGCGAWGGSQRGERGEGGDECIKVDFGFEWAGGSLVTAAGVRELIPT
jgi:hypothetical protein